MARVGAMGFGGVATFYVWHDRPAGQLRCSTGSVAPHELPFSGAYVPSDDLAVVVESFLSDPSPGEVAWSDLDEAQDPPEQAAGEPEDAPFPVWVRGVGPASA